MSAGLQHIFSILGQLKVAYRQKNNRLNSYLNLLRQIGCSPLKHELEKNKNRDNSMSKDGRTHQGGCREPPGFCQGNDDEDETECTSSVDDGYLFLLTSAIFVTHFVEHRLILESVFTPLFQPNVKFAVATSLNPPEQEQSNFLILNTMATCQVCRGQSYRIFTSNCASINLHLLSFYFL